MARSEMTPGEFGQAVELLRLALLGDTPGKRIEAIKNLHEIYLEEFLRLERDMKDR